MKYSITSIANLHYSILYFCFFHLPSKSDDLAKFKKYALELINAALPTFRNNAEIMKGGCECTQGVDMHANASPADIILAIMSIAEYYNDDLQAIQRTPGIAPHQIKKGLMDNIRLIVARLQYHSTYTIDVSVEDIADKFLLKYYKKDPSGSISDTNIKSAIKCLRSKLSFYYDLDHFNDQLLNGFNLVRELMNYKGKDLENAPQWAKLRAIIGQLPGHRLKIASYEHVEYLIKKNFRLLN